MSSIQDISVSLRVASMLPLDAKTLVNTLDDLRNLGEDNNKAFTYYDGLRIYCLEDRKVYEWKEVGHGEKGVLTVNFVYPPATIVGGVDYSNRAFNFKEWGQSTNTGTGSTTSSLAQAFYEEKNVGYRVKNSNIGLEKTFNFGSMDVGAGPENVGLVKTSFTPQGGYNFNDQDAIGDELKLYSKTNGTYLGHFRVSATTYSGYRKLECLAPGDWSKVGDFSGQDLVIHVLKEAPYSLTRENKILKLFRGNLQLGTIDLAPIINDNADVTVVSGVLNATTKKIIFTNSDDTTFEVDVAAMLNTSDGVDKEEDLAVKASGAFESDFILKAGHGQISGGLSIADITTNYNSGNFGGFPYPTGRDFAVCKYDGKLYFLVKNANQLKEIFRTPMNVFAISFYDYRSGTNKSPRKLAYFNVLSLSVPLTGLNLGWQAFPIWTNSPANVPGAVATGAFNEIGIVEGTDSASAHGIFSLAFQERYLPVKSVTLPYTLSNKDNGFLIYANGAGDITVPQQLIYGFHCGIMQMSTSDNVVRVIEGNGSFVKRPDGKTNQLFGQRYTVMITSEDTDFENGTLTDRFILTGDLLDA